MQSMIAKTFVHARLCARGNVIDDGSLTVDEYGRITAVGSGLPSSQVTGETIDLQGQWLLPGLIDVHVHGGGGYDAMDGAYESIEGISRYHAAHGTTSFLITTTTDSEARIVEALKAADEAMTRGVSGAEPVGIHLEGPFIHESRRGAQLEAYILLPDQALLERFERASGGRIRLVTLAPEVAGGLDAVRWYRSRGVRVSVGHSNATYEEVKLAVREGADHTTHHFNGMSPFHHRDPGVAGAGLLISELTTELIADGFHVHPDVVKLLFQVKGGTGICLITDALSCAGLPDGRYDGYESVIVNKGKVMLADGSGLAGSTLTTWQAVVNVMNDTGLPLETVLPSATETPARQAGVQARKGSLTPGKDADLIVVDEHMRLTRTFVRGTEIYSE